MPRRSHRGLVRLKICVRPTRRGARDATGRPGKDVEVFRRKPENLERPVAKAKGHAHVFRKHAVACGVKTDAPRARVSGPPRDRSNFVLITPGPPPPPARRRPTSASRANRSAARLPGPTPSMRMPSAFRQQSRAAPLSSTELRWLECFSRRASAQSGTLRPLVRAERHGSHFVRLLHKPFGWDSDPRWDVWGAIRPKRPTGHATEGAFVPRFRFRAYLRNSLSRMQKSWTAHNLPDGWLASPPRGQFGMYDDEEGVVLLEPPSPRCGDRLEFITAAEPVFHCLLGER
jgi:hypothetical protein